MTKQTLINVATGKTGLLPAITKGIETHWPSLVKAMELYHIDTTPRQAAFLANAIHETACFTRFTENLNYSAQGLANTWPKRFAVDPKATPKEPNDLAKSLHRNPIQIANHVYANRMGNGAPGTGDGWAYRGRGMFHVTGKAGYEMQSKIFGIDFVAYPNKLAEPPYAALSAGYYWNVNNLNKFADERNIRAVRVGINGGLIGFEDVKYYYHLLLYAN